jgi:nitrate/TMAO reductase-like tetraheme cytochrome c subunit
LSGTRRLLPFVVSVLLPASVSAAPAAGDAALGTRSYDDYQSPKLCASCHVDIGRQHEQAMMSQSYTHHWDEIEYFELAVPHAAKEPKVAGVKAGCNGCHAPFAFLAGDVPPPRPEEGSRANEGVSCDLCHSVTGMEGDVPVNFNWISEPGDTKRGIREDSESPQHPVAMTPFLRTAEFCGTCHNEKDPWDLFVKGTYNEWKEGPHGAGGIVCQDCHMPPAEGRSARMAPERPDVRQHLFHGAHDPGKLSGAVEVRIHPDFREAEPGDAVRLTAVVVNAKAGHKIPTGSVEDRMVWLHVEAVDAEGGVHPLAVDPKGFEGEEMTIASAEALAYQDIGDIKDIPDFAGLARDGDAVSGDRIFRMPYLDPQGRMTIAQWNTASFGPDYRLAPLKAVTETFTWTVPDDVPPGPVTVTAEIWYSRLVSSVGRYLNVPEEEFEPFLMSSHSTTFEVY